MLTTERYAPSFSGRGAFGPVFRLSCAIGLIAGAALVYQRSCCTSCRGEATVQPPELEPELTASCSQ